MSKLLVELQYFGTISWYLEVIRHGGVMIEAHENFEKSTYRNRCHIAGPDGKLRLTIPLLHGRNQHVKYSEVRVDTTSRWLKNHWQSLCSCYRRSPYFEYYEDELSPFFHSQPLLLFDFNKQLMLLMFKLLGLSLEIGYSDSYVRHPADRADGRSKIRPGHSQSPGVVPVIYRQVFEDRVGFLPDLCIVDLLFNEGPHSRELLLSAIRD